MFLMAASQANHAVAAAAVQQFGIFYYKMALSLWRGQKATSDIWKELLLFISLFL